MALASRGEIGMTDGLLIIESVSCRSKSFFFTAESVYCPTKC